MNSIEDIIQLMPRDKYLSMTILGSAVKSMPIPTTWTAQDSKGTKPTGLTIFTAIVIAQSSIVFAIVVKSKF